MLDGFKKDVVEVVSCCVVVFWAADNVDQDVDK